MLSIRKVILGALVVGLAVSVSACSAKKTASIKTIHVATSGTLYPTSYHDSKTNKLTGYDVEVMRAVAKQLHKKIKFSEYNVDGQETAVKTGKADVAVDDFAISKQVQKNFLTSTPIKHSFDSILVRKSDNSGIYSWKDLKGKKAADRKSVV